jgi:hypothetical protein
MKLILIILLSVLTQTSNAQVQVPVNNHLNKFIGTWRWTAGQDTFEITLHKQIYRPFLTYPFAGEAIVGWHKYVKNGQLIQSSFQYIGRDINIDYNINNLDLKTTIHGFDRFANKNSLYFLRFWNLSEHQNYEANFTINSGSTTQGVLKITNRTGIKYVDHTGTISLIPKWPRNITLTKL